MPYKEDRDWTIFAHAGLNAICNPSSTVFFEVRSWAMKKKNTNKQTNKQRQQSWHICQKKDFFLEKLSARGYNDAELSKADSSINFEDRQHSIKEKLKSTAIPLVFNTKYNCNFAGKYIRQALLKHWNIINKNVVPIFRYNLKGESVVAAILPSHMEASYCTAGFFVA